MNRLTARGAGFFVLLVLADALSAAPSTNAAPSAAVATPSPAVTNAPPPAVDPHLSAARQALRDGLWDEARLQAAQAGGESGRLVLLESLACENRWDDIRQNLEKEPFPAGHPAFEYYRAAAADKIPEAIDWLKKGGSQAGLVEAKMMAADLLVRNSNLVAAKELWFDVVSDTNASPRAFALASMNLGDAASLRKAYETQLDSPLRRQVGLRLGRALLDDGKTAAEGEKLIRALVADSPDTKEACDAYLSLVALKTSRNLWKDALSILADALEIWPDAIRRADIHEYRGEALFHLGRYKEAYEAFVQAEQLSASGADKARALLKEGDSLAAVGQADDSMKLYRTVLEKYPETATSVALKKVIDLRELESKGIAAYRAYRFDEAMRDFSAVAERDETRRARMKYYCVLCLYGLKRDDQALEAVKKLASGCANPVVRADALLWLAKFTYNKGDWREAMTRFAEYVDFCPTGKSVSEVLLWSARAAFAANDFSKAIQTVTKLADREPNAACIPAAFLVQAESLIELARFDEAVIVLERVSTDAKTTRDERLKAKLLRADALFAMGADNTVRYASALDAYKSVSENEALGPSDRLSVAFKIGRTLEKLKRSAEAFDQYYANVVLAYREARRRGETFSAEGQAAFVRAAFRMADEFEAKGQSSQAIGILKLVAESDVPAADEATKRILRLSKKGYFL